MKRFPIKFISIILLGFLALNSSASASAWLNDEKTATINFSGFVKPRSLEVSAYKGYLSYGLRDNLNLEFSSTCEVDNKLMLRNEISLKAKIIDDYFPSYDYIISAEILTKSIIINNSFHFVNNVGKLLAGLKISSFLFACDLSAVVNQQIYFFEAELTVGYDYSDYSTIIFSRTLSEYEPKWKIAWFKNFMYNLDLSLEYTHYVGIDDYDKFSIGLWYEIR